MRNLTFLVFSSRGEKRPEVLALARQLACKRPKRGKRSLREISAELAAAGFTTRTGKPFPTSSVKRLIACSADARGRGVTLSTPAATMAAFACSQPELPT
jgi:hypothetical protein